MIKAIAIDDETPALKLIENFCSTVDFIQLEKTFNKPNEALRYIQKFPVDLVFLDINMPSLTGLEFYKKVKQHTMAIFTTAYSEHAVEGFNLSAVDYLLKPFTLERFQQAVNKARDYYHFLHHNEKKDQQFLFVRADYSLVKIAMAEILFIEGLDDYLRIHIKDQRPVVVRMTMKTIVQKLPPHEFIRVHRSYIVSFSRIENVRNKIITIQGTEIPVGSSYEENFFKLFRY
ncbi:MAG: LytR/AlgR family response regulator transcription factor [Bacteroidota bacterium]